MLEAAKIFARDATSASAARVRSMEGGFKIQLGRLIGSPVPLTAGACAKPFLRPAKCFVCPLCTACRVDRGMCVSRPFSGEILVAQFPLGTNSFVVLYSKRLVGATCPTRRKHLQSDRSATASVPTGSPVPCTKPTSMAHVSADGLVFPFKPQRMLPPRAGDIVRAGNVLTAELETLFPASFKTHQQQADFRRVGRVVLVDALVARMVLS